MRQTAVEWLVNEANLLENNGWILPLIEQAKEMEKQQIIDAANLQSNDYRGMPTYNKSGEQYYNETFKKI
jgi:hypothetical protein